MWCFKSSTWYKDSDTGTPYHTYADTLYIKKRTGLFTGRLPLSHFHSPFLLFCSSNSITHYSSGHLNISSGIFILCLDMPSMAFKHDWLLIIEMLQLYQVTKLRLHQDDHTLLKPSGCEWAEPQNHREIYNKKKLCQRYFWRLILLLKTPRSQKCSTQSWFNTFKTSSDERWNTSRLMFLSCSKAAPTLAGCHSHRFPAGGAGRACLREDQGPWPSHSLG